MVPEEGDGFTGLIGAERVIVREGVFRAGVLGLGLGVTGLIGLLFGIMQFLLYGY